MSPCTQCGADRWQSLQEAYDTEVRRPEADLNLLGKLAPPLRRASIHGFILGLLVWILLLIPFFASDRARFRDTALTLGAVLLWAWLFRRARKQDAALKQAYLARHRCLACGHVAEISSAAG